MIERSPRAPVLRSIALRAMAPNAGLTACEISPLMVHWHTEPDLDRCANEVIE
jgi:hypothetical protein